MTTLDALLALVEDTTLGPDAWGDHGLQVATELARKLEEAGELERCLQHLPSLEGEAKVRLVQVITAFPSSGLFDPLVGLLAEAEGELAEVLIDRLRTWPLTSEQKDQFWVAAEGFRGRSKLLDLILEDFASRHRQ